jgi:peptide deformylase
MNLVKFPNTALKTPCSNLVEINDLDLVRDLQDADFVRVSHHGVAIAAPQVGLLENWWVQSDDGVPFAIINPSVVKAVGAKSGRMTEGCLSLPGHHSMALRWDKVRVNGIRFWFESGKIEEIDEIWTGYQAQIAQHEYDHLQGVLFTERCTKAEKSRIEGAARKRRK